MLEANKDLIKKELEKITGIKSLKDNEFVVNLLVSDKVESGSAIIKINEYSPSMFDLIIKVRLLSGTTLNIRHVGFIDSNDLESVNTFRTLIKNVTTILSTIL